MRRLIDKIFRKTGGHSPGKQPQNGPLTTGESGRAAQAFAEAALKKSGHKILASNVADKDGELDIVATHKAFDGVIVVEVRAYGEKSPLRQQDVLPRSKQQQVIQAARRLLPARKLWRHGEGIRFDAVLVRLDVQGRPGSCEHFVNAFTTERRDWF